MTDKNEDEILPPYNFTVSIDNKNSIISKKININKEIINTLNEIILKSLNIDIMKIIDRKKNVPGKLIHTIRIEMKIRNTKQISRNKDEKFSKENYSASAPIGSHGERAIGFFLNKSNIFLGRYFLSTTTS